MQISWAKAGAVLPKSGRALGTKYWTSSGQYKTPSPHLTQKGSPRRKSTVLLMTSGRWMSFARAPTPWMQVSHVSLPREYLPRFKNLRLSIFKHDLQYSTHKLIWLMSASQAPKSSQNVGTVEVSLSRAPYIPTQDSKNSLQNGQYWPVLGQMPAKKRFIWY